MIKLQQLLNTLLSVTSDIEAIYLFGSYANDEQNGQSDIDLALLLPVDYHVEWSEWIILQQQLELALDHKVNLLNVRQLSTVLQKEIIAANQRVWYADEQAADEFELRVLGDYLKLNQKRRAFVDAGMATGFIAT